MQKRALKISSIILTAMMLLIVSVTAVWATEAPDAETELTVEGSTVRYTVEHEDNEEMFLKYAEKTFGADEAAPKGTLLTGEKMTGQNLAAYNYLKPLLEQVADGELDSASFSIPAASLGLQATYTATDLDLDYLLDSNRVPHPDLWGKVQALLTLDGFAVVARLWADCPYEMYWANGLVECSDSLGYRISSTKVTLGAYGISFHPDTPYLDTSSEDDDCAILTNVTGTVSNAKDCALGIVSDAAALSDYGKLVYYKDRICDLVTYNNAAALASATEEGHDAYVAEHSKGAWALIYVFDQDEDTNVVCEGYAEAFQYLGSLTRFECDDICVYSVTGMMSGATGAGRHKWNIVRMDDGYNYLADVTNSDEGSVGSDGSLFLKGYMSGSVSAGYSFGAAAPAPIDYIYDDSMLVLYTTAELTLRSVEYGVVGAKVVGHRMLLSSEIGVQFKVYAPNGLGEDAYMEYSLSDGKEQRMDFAAASAEDNNIYMFTCYINPIELADSINATLHYTLNGEEETVEDDYSAMMYVDAARATFNTNEKLTALLNALQNYGYYLQNSGWTDGRDHRGIECVNELSANDLNTAKSAVSNDAIVKNLPAASGVEDLMFSLLLNAKTQIYYYAKVSDSVSLTTEYDSVKTIEGEEYYQFASAEIGPRDLATASAFTIETSGGDATATASAMSYVYAILNGSASDAQKNAMAAFYFYYAAASAY